ncbi:MAG TPA: hypothetical protein VG603_03720 [Chitinophagales bacterium]|nr:hypothetical protein [Chitinophagales bacterium]
MVKITITHPEKPAKTSKAFSASFFAICFLLGAIVCTTGDFIHVVTKTDGYPADGPFPFLPFLPVNMPVWVPLLFGSAVVLIGTLHKICAPYFTPHLAHNKSLALASPLIFLALYAGSGLIPAQTGGFQDIWLGLAALSFWRYADGTPIGALLAVVAAICGTAFEMMLVHIHGFFYYPCHANFFGAPSWLPWLYVAASVSVSLFVRYI